VPDGPSSPPGVHDEHADLNLACATALVDELVAAGAREACVSPGSRSTSIALALWRDDRIRVHIHLDERSAGFFALGLAKVSARPVIVTCTSGTAAAALLPPVVEASRSRVPLVLLTADRPPRLRGTGANQTIDQVDLYGRHAVGYLEPPVPAGDEDIETWRHAGREAGQVVLGRGEFASGTRRGPVQVNCPFEEPLVPSTDAAAVPGVTPSGPPLAEVPTALNETDMDELSAELSGRRGIIVAGPEDGAPALEILDLAERLGWPVLAEPLSDLRLPDRALAAGPSLIRSPSFIERMRPEVALQIGATPTMRSTRTFLEAIQGVIVVDRLHPDPDPDARARQRIRCTPTELVAGLHHRDLEPAPDGWRVGWEAADARARLALDVALDAPGATSQLRLARDLAGAIRSGGVLLVGNSMPVRDLEIAMAPREGLSVLANRGASGIDGLVATALGVAAATEGPTFAFLGDLSLLYDAGSLLWAGRTQRHDTGPRSGCTIVVANNDGGAIFSTLDQGRLPELAPLFTTPHGLDLAAVSAAARAGHVRVRRPDDLDDALAAPADATVTVVEVMIDPDADREHQRRVQAAVDAAVA
jgi:2-succinyl-5-enolpyruvyl-6-hydroxy-3-cyclohexene-1-carboxylate synthase